MQVSGNTRIHRFANLRVAAVQNPSQAVATPVVKPKLSTTDVISNLKWMFTQKYWLTFAQIVHDNQNLFSEMSSPAAWSQIAQIVVEKNLKPSNFSGKVCSDHFSTLFDGYRKTLAACNSNHEAMKVFKSFQLFQNMDLATIVPKSFRRMKDEIPPWATSSRVTTNIKTPNDLPEAKSRTYC